LFFQKSESPNARLALIHNPSSASSDDSALLLNEYAYILYKNSDTNAINILIDAISSKENDGNYNFKSKVEGGLYDTERDRFNSEISKYLKSTIKINPGSSAIVYNGRVNIVYFFLLFHLTFVF
jgi:hypothetical protein